MRDISFERIGQYLNGELNEQDRLLFESELASDEELASAFNLYKEIEHEMRAGKEDTGRTSLKNNLQQLGKTYFKNSEAKNSPITTSAAQPISLHSLKNELFEEETTIKSTGTWKKFAVAAIIIGVIFLGIVMYENSLQKNYPVAGTNKKTDSSINIIKTDTPQIPKNLPEQNLAIQNKSDTNKAVKQKKQIHINSKSEVLFANNFKPDTIPENTAGPLEDALAYYEKGDYKNTVASIETADLNTELRGQEMDAKHIIFYAHYYKALSYLEETNAVKAIPELNNAIKESPDSVLQIKAQWYLALAYLKSNDIEKSKELLLKIVSVKHENTFQLQALNLLSDLKKNN